MSDEAADLLQRIARDLHDVYAPAGVLMFWSSGITYLDGVSPAEAWHRRDLVLLRRLAERTACLADGNFA